MTPLRPVTPTSRHPATLPPASTSPSHHLPHHTTSTSTCPPRRDRVA
eukprot:CAMPEP_0119529692 /NCGR_PEP_ID=MMETSP1344-20130328/43656_1 /TAXON_ID=236787 /ORGANISM="Florenciella parvula, Strain CCMP2471" /LENGTH=46 /DNA_ID= /DNA_START= /DNA_END= /DNA_ORIENTATION=